MLKKLLVVFLLSFAFIGCDTSKNLNETKGALGYDTLRNLDEMKGIEGTYKLEYEIKKKEFIVATNGFLVKDDIDDNEYYKEFKEILKLEKRGNDLLIDFDVFKITNEGKKYVLCSGNIEIKDPKFIYRKDDGSNSSFLDTNKPIDLKANVITNIDGEVEEKEYNTYDEFIEKFGWIVIEFKEDVSDKNNIYWVNITTETSVYTDHIITLNCKKIDSDEVKDKD